MRKRKLSLIACSALAIALATTGCGATSTSDSSRQIEVNYFSKTINLKNVYFYDFEYYRLIHGVTWNKCKVLSGKEDTDIFFNDPKGNTREAHIVQSLKDSDGRVKIYQDLLETKYEEYEVK